MMKTINDLIKAIINPKTEEPGFPAWLGSHKVHYIIRRSYDKSNTILEQGILDPNKPFVFPKNITGYVNVDIRSLQYQNVSFSNMRVNDDPMLSATELHIPSILSLDLNYRNEQKKM